MAEKLTKNEKREAAREKARAEREQAQKKQKRNSILIKVGSLVGILAVAGIVVLVIVTGGGSTPAVAQINPKNMISNGVVFDGTIDRVVPSAAIPEGGKATPTAPSADKVNVDIYVDYSCPYCKKFETAQNKVLADYVNKGEVVVEYHPIAFLTNYSIAAGNASACVASNEPDKWWTVNSTLFDAQPEEKTAQGWSPASSISYVKDTLKSLNLSSATKDCIKDTPYQEWLNSATNLALNGPIPNSDQPKVQGTPYVIVDGKVNQVDYINDTTQLTKMIEEAKLAKKK